MPPNPSQPGSLEADPAPGLQVGDIYYILFRHKWKIVICTLVGLIASGVLYARRSPYYTSQAKLLVHYVTETRIKPTGGGETFAPDGRGETLMNAEIEILTSFDLLRDVAGVVGPARILGPEGMRAAAGEPTNNSPGLEARAAGVIKDRLRIAPPGKGSVLAVEFAHPDRTVPQVVLGRLIDLYFTKHKEIHNPLDYESLAKKADAYRATIADIEGKLRDLKKSAKVVSIEDTMKAHFERMSAIQTELGAARAELAEKNAAVMSLTNRLAMRSSSAAGNTNAGAPPLAKLDDYRRLISKLEVFIKREQELLRDFTTNNPVVREVRANVDEWQREKAKFEQEDPGLARALALGPAGPLGPTASAADPALMALFQDTTRVVSLTARIADLTNQLATVETAAAAVEDVEIQIRELLRLKEIEEAKYKTYANTLEEKRAADAFGQGQLPNITRIQNPTPPGTDSSKFLKKLALIAGGGLGIGLLLAFLIELFLDQSIRKPGDLSRKLHLPVFITVPRLQKLRGAHRKHRALPAPNGSSNNLPATLPALQSITATSSAVQPYCDALRDRLIHYFQRNNMSHKPKLVAVTGCRDGSGVSTLAAGLAASLSETGDGNVLLVDTNVTEGAAHPFYRGKLACGLNDVLKEDLRGGAQVQDNLYVASASESDGALIKALPKRFSQLVPKLKASDYDYIIFDMPQITQTSITTKLAGYMDIVLLVVESEKTSRTIVSEAAELLRESRANVATVLNKSHRYIPRWVHREFE